MEEADEGLPAKCARLSFARTIEVAVGETETKFYVHPDIIRPRSCFFDAALARWKKDAEPIRLTDDDPRVFNLYLEYLYSGKLSCSADRDESDLEIIDAYNMADRLRDLDTTNGLIDPLMEKVHKRTEVLEHRVVRHAWDSTPAMSPLRKYIVELYTVEVKAAELANLH